MKKKYSRKQIQEALHWWKAQLKRLDESKEFDDFDTQVQSDELAGDYGKEEDGGEPDYSEYEAAVKRYHQKAEENLEAERKQLGLGPDEVVCLIMGGLCIYNGKTHETRGLTKEQYDKHCELSKKWQADWEENVGKHWPKKKSKKKVDESAEHEYEVVATALGKRSATIDQTVNARDLHELAEFVREDFARELGVDAEDVRFTFDKVVDENGKDVTQQANEKRLNESKATSRRGAVKKNYTKKQITEAVAYWKSQLKKGNYKKVNESFGKKYDHTDPELGDQYPGGNSGPALSWGELKAAVDKQLSDDDQVDNISLICGPEDVELGIGLAYVDVDKSNEENTLVFSITGY